MNRMLTAATLCLALSTPAFADGKIYVQLPDLSDYKGQQGEDFLYQVLLANIVASNCVGYETTDEEWSLLVDSADLLSYQLGFTTDEYVEKFETPAFAALDEPGICESEGPKVQPIIDALVAHGGSREALPDQEQAYEDFQVMRAKWDEVANGTASAPSGKTKVK